jgi:predicted nucleic acid-binding protein
MVTVVSNASPLILLAGVGQFERLRDLFTEILVSPKVFEEVAIRGKGRPGSDEVANAPFVKQKPVAQSARVSELRERAQLAEGEASTIILAGEIKADLVLIDEKAARAAAKGLGLKVAGTMRVLELAYERTLIKDLRETYDRLKAGPAHLAPGLLDASLAKYKLPPLT